MFWHKGWWFSIQPSNDGNRTSFLVVNYFSGLLASTKKLQLAQEQQVLWTCVHHGIVLHEENNWSSDNDSVVDNLPQGVIRWEIQIYFSTKAKNEIKTCNILCSFTLFLKGICLNLWKYRSLAFFISNLLFSRKSWCHSS